MATARATVPIAEENPFLTGKHLAPSDRSGHQSGISPRFQYDIDEYENGLEAEEGSECSEESAESDYGVDEEVREEMSNLEDTFRDIGMKFRMIARIGEGIVMISMSLAYYSNVILTSLLRNLLDRLQSRRLALRLL